MDVHKGGGGSGPCGRMWTGEGGQKRDFFVDVINGWPLIIIVIIIIVIISQQVQPVWSMLSIAI